MRSTPATLAAGATAVLLCTLAAASLAGAATRPAAIGASHPPGYQIVSSGTLSAAPGAFDTGGSVTCPAGTVVWGGGVSFVNVHFGPGLTVNTSEPMESTGWEARVNNTTTSAAQFVVEAVCANKPKGYQRVFRAVDNPAGSQSHATATCPFPKVVLGGGTLSTSDQAAAVLTSAWPSGSDKFKGYLYNGTTADASLTVYAICGNKPAGYTSASGSSPVGPNSTLLDVVGCPAGTSALDAGGQTVGHSPLVLVNGLIDQNASSWVLFMDNTAPSDQEIVGHVTCAT